MKVFRLSLDKWIYVEGWGQMQLRNAGFTSDIYTTRKTRYGAHNTIRYRIAGMLRVYIGYVHLDDSDIEEIEVKQ